MRALVGLVALVGLIGMVGVGAAAPPPGKRIDPGAALGALGESSAAASLAVNVRALLLTVLPEPLFEDSKNWGLRKKGPLGRVHNDGRWWKVRLSAVNPKDTLILDIRDLVKHGKGRSTFNVFIACDVRVVLDRQTWKAGARLYSGSMRARLRVRATLACEVLTRVVPGKGLFPDTTFRLRVLGSQLAYDNVVVEHTAGVGGEAAKVLGDAVLGTLKQVKPSLERRLLEKANAAVVKAGDTREIKLGLSSLVGDN